MRQSVLYIGCMISKPDNNLRTLRRKKGLLQKELAEQSGVELRTIQSYEQGKRELGNSDLVNVLRLAVALDCTVSDLLVDENLKELCKKARL